MKILYAASEALPFAASGGLADVAGSLPKALCAAGHETVSFPSRIPPVSAGAVFAGFPVLKSPLWENRTHRAILFPAAASFQEAYPKCLHPQ